MIVKAKCMIRAWDKRATRLCYPGEVYEIDHDGPLAGLKVGSEFVFQFDRTMSGTGVPPGLGGYVCKKCKAVFNSVNELGTHSNSAHKTVETPEEVHEEQPDPILPKKHAGNKKGVTFTCRKCGESLPNLYALRVHHKEHKQAEAVKAEAVSGVGGGLNYSQAQISNLALGRIGARGGITDINEGSPNAVKILNVWDAVFQEVLSERDWRFAKTRASLQLSPVVPLYAYLCAWALPADLLRFVRPVQHPQNKRHYWWGWGPEGNGWYRHEDPPFWPSSTDYRIETLTAGWQSPLTDPPVAYPSPFPAGRYALTNYDGSYGPVMITYIQLISDYSQLMPGFVNCLAYRLAQELSLAITEDKQKFQQMEQMYRNSLNSAEAQNECMDFSEDESGSTTWEDAGRWMR